MEMNIHHDGKTVDIWLTGSEARDESFRRSLEPYYRQFAKHKYFVSVFESGDRELLPDTVLLLRHNLELQMKAEPATEQVQGKPPIPPRLKQENRARVHEPGQNIRIDQSEV